MLTTSTPLRRHATAWLLGACLVAAGFAAVGTPAHAAGAPQRVDVQRLQATLRPSGDPNGSGEAHFRLNRAKRKVCASVEWHNIATPNAAHIHRRSDGAVLVDLTGSVTGGAQCARGVPRRLIDRLLAHPRRYYFNVHNATYPAGAIQGTLHH